MRSDLQIPLSLVLGFLFTLARVSGATVFVPMLNFRNAPMTARVMLSVFITLALFPVWPDVEPAAADLGRLLGTLASEAAFGLMVGVAAAAVTEALVMAAQLISLQSGYGYAAMVDPNTNADSSVLLVMAQLMAGLLFFAFGFDRQILMSFGRSLEAHPPGALLLPPATAQQVIAVGAGIFLTGFRLALPVLAFLLLIDVSLALLGRMNSHLHVLTLAFPSKMAVTVWMMSWVILLFPKVFHQMASRVITSVAGMING